MFWFQALNVFGSSWQVNLTDEFILDRKLDMVDPATRHGYYGTPYPFGVDPVWQLAENKSGYLEATSFIIIPLLPAHYRMTSFIIMPLYSILRQGLVRQLDCQQPFTREPII